MDLKNDSLCEPVPQPGLKPEEVLDFRIPVNPLGPSKRAERKMVKHLSAAFRYPEARASDLIQTLARFHGLCEEEIVLGAGATEFIYAFPRALSIRRALVVTPISGEYERALETAGHAPRPQIDYFEAREEDGFEMDVNGLISSLTLGYDALYLSNPGFPTGILTSKEDLLRVLAQTERHRVWFLLDETSIDFAEEQSLKEKVISSSRLLILRSFSNFFALPGLRVGYLLGSREAIRNFRNALPPGPSMPWGRSPLRKACRTWRTSAAQKSGCPRRGDALLKVCGPFPVLSPIRAPSISSWSSCFPFSGSTAGGFRKNFSNKGSGLKIAALTRPSFLILLPSPCERGGKITS